MDNQRRYRIRYSLAHLFSFISLVGVGLAALKHPNPWWAVGLTHLTFFMLLLAAIVGVYSRSAFAGGFALGGVAWLVLLFVFSLSGMRDPNDMASGVTIDSQGNVTGYTKGPYAIEENVLHPEQICHRLSSIFRDPTHGMYMLPEVYRCFRIEAYCVATWVIGLLTGTLALAVRTTGA